MMSQQSKDTLNSNSILQS